MKKLTHTKFFKSNSIHFYETIEIAGKSGAVQPNGLVVLRIILGIILLWKAISFIHKTSALKLQIEENGIAVFPNSSAALAIVITYIGLLCGIFITIGLFTKLACIIQFPILFVAVFFVNIKNMN